MWPVIGARLDFVQFHATDGEPARSGPGIGLQLAQIYQAMLQDFDNWYITQFFESRKNALAGNHQAQANAARNPQQMQQLMAMSHMSVGDLRAQGVEEKMIHFVEQNRATLQRSFQEQRSFQNRMRNANLSQAGGGPHAQAAAIAMQQQNGGSGQPQGQPRAVAPGMGGPGASLPFANSPVGQQQQQQNVTATRNQFAVGVPQFVQQGPQTNQQQQQVPGGQNMQAARMMQQPQKVTLALADSLIQRCRHEYTTNRMFYFFSKVLSWLISGITLDIPGMHAVDVPVEQRNEYNHLLESTLRMANEAEQKLQMVVAVLQKEDIIRKLILIVSFRFLISILYIYLPFVERSVPFNTSDRCWRQRRLAMLSLLITCEV